MGGETPEMEVELLPCPFCGGQEVSLHKDSNGYNWSSRFWVSCDCGAHGPDATTDIKGVAAWNRRPRRAGEGGEGWVPIETAPRDGTPVLLLAGGIAGQASYQGPSDGAIYSGGSSRYNWFCEVSHRSFHDEIVTHWRPLPAPPHPQDSKEEGSSSAAEQAARVTALRQSNAGLAGRLTGEDDPRLIVAQWMAKTPLEPRVKEALRAVLRTMMPPNDGGNQ